MPRPLSDDVLTHCYRLILGREPDAAGLAFYRTLSLMKGIGDPHQIARAMFASREFASRFVPAAGPPDIFADVATVAWRGVTFTLPRQDFTFRDLGGTGTYEPWVSDRLFAELRPGGTFLDIGANLGLYALPAALRVGPAGRVIAIEPARRNADLLWRNAVANGLANVDVYPVAASDSNGCAVSRAEAGTTNHRLAAATDARTAGQAELVPTVTLDTFLAADRAIDLVKIDVEGYEHRALSGARGLVAAYRPVIYLEYNDHLQRLSSGVPGAVLLRMLFDQGYRATILHRTRPAEPVAAGDAARIDAAWRACVGLGGTHLDLRLAVGGAGDP